MISLSPTELDIFTALRTFLLSVLPAGTEVLQAQANRVPEHKGDDFVTMTPTRRSRLATNIDKYIDCAFTGSIAGTVLAVTYIRPDLGPIQPGRALFGIDVAAGTQITAQLSGTTGGLGTYRVSVAQTLTARTLAAGSAEILQPTLIVIQLDVHGPASGDNAQIITTMFRDPYAVEQFAASNAAISPLYADDARQLPFNNGEQQVENRWSIDVALQANQSVIGIGQQFADAVTVDLVNVDAAYPDTAPSLDFSVPGNSQLLPGM